MTGPLLIVVFIVAYALVSKALAKTPITGPMVFVAFGLLIGPIGFSLVDVDLETEVIQIILEGTLVVVLFTDATVIDINTVRRSLQLPSRLLSIGLVLTIVTGTVVAEAMFGSLGFWGAAVVAIALAPTDAALGQAVVTNPRVPAPIRQALSVESGLNDGIAVPLLSVAIAGTIGEMSAGTDVITLMLREIGIAVIVGVVVGLVGGFLVSTCYDRGWMSETWQQVAVPLIALMCFGLSDPIDGSGFIAAFVGGIAFGAVVRRRYSELTEFSEAVSYLFTMLSFLLFGVLILSPAIERITWQLILYGVLSLTVVRMIPVAISMLGSGTKAVTVGFLGWFGPRGLASLVFAGTIIAELDPVENQLTLDLIATTVGLSVLLHGLTAWPLSHRYGTWAARQDEDMVEMMDTEPVRVRMRVTAG